MISRRRYLGGLVASGAAPLVPGTSPTPPAGRPGAAKTSGRPHYTPVVTPNGSTLPFAIKDGVKEFRLIAEPVKREFAPGMVVNCWGYNGSTPGPTIEAVEGDRVRLFVTNRLPEHTTCHWHGILLPAGMDGVGGLNQPHIKPGETFVYEFTLRQHGTYMYHPHADEAVQMAMGMFGFLVIHPRKALRAIARDFCIFPHEWLIDPGTATPNPNVMADFNIFTFNSRAYPGTDPLVVRTGDRVRIRFANVSMDSHPIHFHGHRWWITETDGGQIAESGWWPETTVNVPPGTTRTVEFVADNPGDWAMHCHKSHHAMNAMNHDVPNVIGVDQTKLDAALQRLVPGAMVMGSTGMAEHASHAEHVAGGVPNTLPMMTGAGPFGPIEMGGMFTILKVRDHLDSYAADPGWYEYPPGTIARKIEAD
jgi:FtsP/CotA-like multicopper oxidase with cupredoxin domain